MRNVGKRMLLGGCMAHSAHGHRIVIKHSSFTQSFRISYVVTQVEYHVSRHEPGGP